MCIALFYLAKNVSVCLHVCVCLLDLLAFLVLLVIFYLPKNAAAVAAAAALISECKFAILIKSQSELVYMCQSFVWMFVIF